MPGSQTIKMEVYDLRSAIDWLTRHDDPPLMISTPVRARYELASHYSMYGGTPVAAPTGKGPSVYYEKVTPAEKSVLAGLFGTRKRCAILLGTEEERMSDIVLSAIRYPIEPEVREEWGIDASYREGVDLNKLPIPTMTPDDAGPYITLGVVVAKHPVTGEANVSIHRLWVKSGNELTIWMVPGRDLERFHHAAKGLGTNLPITINIGLDPAVYIAASCTGAIAPYGCNELSIAGGIRKRPVKLSPCRSNSGHYIANAEYVLEGEITHEYCAEGDAGGYSMPEFLGYTGKAHPYLPIIKITGIRERRDAIFQTVIGPGYEQSNLLAVGMEASILHFLRQHFPTPILNAYCSSSGGGQLLAFVQVNKRNEQDDVIARQAGIALISTFRMIKQVVMVDEDVNLFSEEEAWWAMATRFQADSDLIVLPGMQGFPLDPSQMPGMSSSIKMPGMTSKAVFDCTVPYQWKHQFRRTSFSPI
ncbi:UbiD family decarboxylase [Paenibacillus sp. GCM10027627]